MNDPVEKVLAYLTGNKNIEDVSVTELQTQEAENPYFPVTQFLLAKKLMGENGNAYSVQVQKTALYFSNHYWLSYLLSGNHSIVPGTVQLKQDEDKSLIEEHAVIAEPYDPVTDSTHYNVPAAESHIVSDMVYLADAPTSVNDKIPQETVPSLVRKDSTSLPTERPNISQVEEEMAAMARDTNEATDTFVDQLEPTTINAREFPSLENFAPAIQMEVNELGEEMAGASHLVDDATGHFLEDADDTDKRPEVLLDDEHDRMFQNIKAMLDATSEDADKDTQNAVVPIDPYYTIDYFASQGIKLELEKHPEDQLGQHLKKFTQWLKHMKKLGPEDATEAINRSQSDADIQQIADSSNTVREVVTEAMALVLEKQGKNDKAVELYNKLSFLNPDKRAYFADKIKKIKGI